MGYTEGGAISHAVIVWGGSESDRNACASAVAQAAVCSAQVTDTLSPMKKPCHKCPHCIKAERGTHPDIIIEDRREDKQNILVDQIRAIREDAVVMPNEAEKKVYIIRQAGTMNTQAQNALLKLLEEPPECSSFILVAKNPSELLPTVRSRCVELYCHPKDTIQTEPEIVTAFEEALSGGVLKLNAFSYKLDKLDRNSFNEFLDGAADLLIRRLRDVLTGVRQDFSEEYLLKALRVLDRAKQYADVNVSSTHIAGMICAELMN